MKINPKELRRVMSALGKIGGSKSSDRKTRAARKNAKRPRPMRWKLCPNCEGGLSETDKQAGYCTQCGASLRNKS